jgi:phosphohistidine phosphatase
MKKLIILRHGKSDWNDPEMDDYDRFLTARGIENSNEMGKFILKKGGKPDLIISSSAKRAFQTAVLVAENLNYSTTEIVKEDRFYLASSDTILRLLMKSRDEISSILMVGHNPGLTDLINKLGVRLDNLPTASAVCFEFEIENWSNLNPKKSKYLWSKMAREL